MGKNTKSNGVINNHTVLIIVAHTDDETLGLGGTIAKHVESGDIVYAISMTDGVGARGHNSGEEIKARIQASINAGKILGLTWVEGGNFPDNAMVVPKISTFALARFKNNSRL